MRLTKLAAVGALLAAVTIAPAASGAEKKPVNLTAMTVGYTYYNKPGADLETHNRTVFDCLRVAGSITSYGVGQPKMGLAGAIGEAGATRAARAGALEGCMVVRGWRVVKISDADGLPLSKQGPAAIGARLATEVGAETPWGEIVRVWGNEALRSSTRKTGSLPFFERGLLSYQAATGQTAFRAGLPLTAWASKPERRWQMKKPLTPASLAEVPPGSAVVIIGIADSKVFMDNIWAYSFMRAGPDVDSFPSNADGLQDFFGFYNMGTRGKASGPRFEMRVIPPGRWRLASLDDVVRSLNLCLGAPSFEIAAGEVVYLGTFLSSSEDLTPAMAMEPVQAFLGDAPQAGTVRPAVYSNGSLGPCEGATIYALEFTGAASEPGYRERLRQ
ncbi:MAG: hypothetical protein HY859_13930 [Caulobacterales bacterium]|nr:hypothetical protein [Caulobacterales bacterium]